MKKECQLEKLDRDRSEHRRFMEKVVLDCHPRPYVAPALSADLLEDGVLNPYHYRDDFSFVMRVQDEPVGMVVLTVPRDNEAWELGLFHVLPPWQKQGIGSFVLAKVEEKVRDSGRGLITTWFFSPRSIPNGIPALSGEALSFFTKRGYYLKPVVESAYRLTRSHYDYDRKWLKDVESKNAADGFAAADVRVGDARYEEVVRRCVSFCEREGAGYWAEIFRNPRKAVLRTGISFVEKQGEMAAFAVYTFEPIAPSGWAYGPHWGPILTGKAHRERGLASWLVRNSLDAQFAGGATEVFLWADFGGRPSKMYERFGFQPVCSWFSIEKKF